MTSGWHPDPSDRHEFRYHNGTDWTADVADDGERFVDPLPPASCQGQLSAGLHRSTGETTRAATASLALGVTAVALGWLPFVFVIGGIAAILSLIFGTIGFRRSRRSGPGRSRAIGGLLTGGTGLVLVVVGGLLTVALIDAVDRYDNPGDYELGEVTCTNDGSAWTASGTIENLTGDTRSYLLTVDFVRPGTDNAQARSRLSVDDIPTGETASFEVRRQVALDDVECLISQVDGPAPFGIDLGS